MNYTGNTQLAMGQNPNRTPSELPIPTKINENGWCTYQKMVLFSLTHRLSKPGATFSWGQCRNRAVASFWPTWLRADSGLIKRLVVRAPPASATQSGPKCGRDSPGAGRQYGRAPEL